MLNPFALFPNGGSVSKADIIPRSQFLAYGRFIEASKYFGSLELSLVTHCVIRLRVKGAAASDLPAATGGVLRSFQHHSRFADLVSDFVLQVGEHFVC